MSDDWSSSTDERDWQDLPAADEPASDLPRDVDPAYDQDERQDERDHALLDAFYHELALEDAKDPRPNTPEEQAEVDALLAWAQRLMGTPEGGER